jgi:hypothetical protein
MTIGRVLTATLALALAVALSPLFKVQAAPFTGSSAQQPSLILPVAEKTEKTKTHHRMHNKGHKMHHRHHRGHVRASKGGCHGTYMYYSRKAHKCMDARSK